MGASWIDLAAGDTNVGITPTRALPSWQGPPQPYAEFADGKAHGHAEHETAEHVFEHSILQNEIARQP
jgi:hypothetical protein